MKDQDGARAQTNQKTVTGEKRSGADIRRFIWRACLGAAAVWFGLSAVPAARGVTWYPSHYHADAAAVYAADGEAAILEAYREYEERFAGIARVEDIETMGYEVVEKHVFDVPLLSEMLISVPDGEEMVSTEVMRPGSIYQMSEEDLVVRQEVPTVRFYCAIEKDCHRAAVFLADAEGRIVYKTNQLECNYTVLGKLTQPVYDMVSVAFLDLNGDNLKDIILIAGCADGGEPSDGETFKVGEVLFQQRTTDGTISFYRDWRINDMLNRFGMNKSAKCIRSFVRDGVSTEFLYTATTEEELMQNGFSPIKEQCRWRNYEKLGNLKVLPGIFSMADYNIFMIYMIDEEGDIVWSFQPMGEYDNLYALRGMSSRDLDGDGMKDMLVVARYSREGENGELIVEGQYSVYYQRTGGFETDEEFVETHPYRDDCSVEELGKMIQAYWAERN